jgi:hypothetical protein
LLSRARCVVVMARGEPLSTVSRSAVRGAVGAPHEQ